MVGGGIKADEGPPFARQNVMKQNDFDEMSSESSASHESSSITSFENSEEEGTKTTVTESEANSETKAVLERMGGPGVALLKKPARGLQKRSSKQLMTRKMSRVLSRGPSLELPELTKGGKKKDDQSTPNKKSKSADSLEEDRESTATISMDSDLEKINEELAEKSLSESEVSEEEKADTVDDEIFDPKTFGAKVVLAKDGLESIAEENEDENAGDPTKDKGLAAFMAKEKAEKHKQKKSKRREKRVPLRPFQAPARVLDCTADTPFEHQKWMPIWPAKHATRRWPGPEERHQYIFDRANIEKTVFDPF